jgi:hypothetical protein
VKVNLIAAVLFVLCGCARTERVTLSVDSFREHPGLEQLRKLPVPSPIVPYEHERLRTIYLAGFEWGWKFVMEHGISAFGALIVGPEELRQSATERDVWFEGYHASHKEAVERIWGRKIEQVSPK